MINKSNKIFLKFSFNRYNKTITWFPVKDLIAVSNEQATSWFNRNIKSNSYFVHYSPYKGAKKGKQVASSTKWELWDNVVLRLMECLTPTASFDLFIDNYFTSFPLFVLLTHLEVKNIRSRGGSTKIGNTNMLSSETNS